MNEIKLAFMHANKHELDAHSEYFISLKLETNLLTPEEQDEPDHIETKKAIKEISIIAFPTMIFYLCIHLEELLNLSFLSSKYNDDVLIEAVGISHFYLNCILLSIASGMITGFETIGSNAFGCKNFELLGIFYQRVTLITLSIMSFLLIISYFFGISIISLFPVSAEALIYAEDYFPIAMFLVLFEIFYGINFRFLNIMDKSYINVFSLLISLAFHPLWLYLFIDKMDLGVTGAALALLLTQFINFILGLFYILRTNFNEIRLFKLTSESLKGWKDYLSLAVPITFMTCSEWWAFELQAFIALWVSNDDFKGYVLLNSIGLNFYSILLGFGMAATILTGKYISEGKSNKTRQIVHYVYSYSVGFVAVVGLIVYILREQIMLFLSADNENLHQLTTSVIYIMCIAQIFDVFQTVSSSICRGVLRHKIASVIVFVNFYIIQVGLSMFLGKYLEWGLKGIMTSACIGCFFAAVTFAFYLYKINYNQLKEEVLQKLQEDEKELLYDTNEYLNWYNYRRSHSI